MLFSTFLFIVSIVVSIIIGALPYVVPPPKPEVIVVVIDNRNATPSYLEQRSTSTNLQYDNDSEIKGFEETHVMIFIGFGFLMSFLKKYSYSALGLNLLLGAFSTQWALICQNLFYMKDGHIELSKKLLAEANIMSATVLITFGVLLGFTSPYQIFFISIVEIAVGCTNMYLIREVFKQIWEIQNDGCPSVTITEHKMLILNTRECCEAADRGGAMAIHMFGALFGIGASSALNIRRPAAGQSTPLMAVPSYFSDITAMIGTLFLWVYWPSFNAVLCRTSWEYQATIINTYLSLVSSAVMTFSVSGLVTKDGKLDMMHVQRSTLAGGVVVGSCASLMFPPVVAVVVGMLAAVISTLGYKYITPRLAKLRVLDTCGVLNVHGLPGVLSGLLSILFTSLADASKYGEELVKQILPHGGGVNQALAQLYALLTTIVIALAAGLATGFIARLLPSLKDEEKYIDDTLWKLPE